MRRAAIFAALALCLSGCAKPKLIDARPALWRVSDGDTTIWLFGTIHALPPSVRWETPAVARAIAASDTLILEIPPEDSAIARKAFVFASEAPGLPPLLDRVAPADRSVVTRGMAVAGQAPASLDAMQTWAAALTISAGAGHVRDASAADGVEAVLTRRFAGKRIGALETLGGQFAVFDHLPPASQRVLLVQAARDALDPAHGHDTLLKAWAAGDERALAATVAPLLADAAIGTTLVQDRNARWASAILRRMARSGRVFVAVGAGHLVGPGSVVAMLRARGWKVERVE